MMGFCWQLAVFKLALQSEILRKNPAGVFLFLIQICQNANVKSFPDEKNNFTAGL